MRFINIINAISMTLLSTSSLTLWAGQRVGNGGFIVNCPNSPEVPVNGLHLLDYLDGELRFPALGKVNLPLDGDAESKARFVFERLKRVDPIRAEKYLAELDHFFDPEITRFLPQGYRIPTAGDFGDTMTPTNCTIVQVVANTIPTEPEEPKYWISQPLWDQLNEMVRAGLIIHEIVYNDALLRGHSTSERARYFTFLISSDKILTIDQKTYDERVLKNEL
ncbi:MAG: hypothetical protein NT027_01915, partial [Proteobacteria bacterium]|nr:hypothetical protein [Pseudomonadota bacterium]